MSTGPEHYREAEKWAQRAAELWPQDSPGAIPIAHAAAAIAQAYATLALVASNVGPHDGTWQAAIGKPAGAS